MKQGFGRGLALLMGGLAALTSCAVQPAEVRSPAMGRYVEEVLPLPEDMVSLNYLGVEGENSFILIGETNRGDTLVWTSADGGGSWSVQSPDWLAAMEGYTPDAIAFDGAGNPWFTNEIQDPTIDELYEKGGQAAIDAYVPPAFGLFAIQNGTAAEQNFTLTDARGYNANSFLVGEDYLAAASGGLTVYSRQDGGSRAEIPSEAMMKPGDYLLNRDTLAVSDGSGMKLYSAENGDILQELSFQKAAPVRQTAFFGPDSAPRSPIAMTGEDNVYAYCNGSGVYRVSADGLIHERVVDGALCSLSLPTLSIERLFVAGGSYYVYVTDQGALPWELTGAALLRYRYDGAVPTEPTTELRVFSLQDSPTVRQAVGLFQRENPEVRVRFEIAADLEAGAGLSDAMTALSTELLAGKGPDVLILDGLPIEHYMDKGVLLELGGLIPPELQEALLSNLLIHREGDSGIYAIPARFTLPMILGDRETITSVSTLSGLADCVTGLQSPQIGVPPSELFDLLYPLLLPQWRNADGTLNETAAAEGLEDIARILRLYDGKDEEQLWNARGDANAGAIGWAAGWTPFFLHNLTSYEQLDVPCAVERERGGVYTPYPSNGSPVLYPAVTAGVNANSEKRALAVLFVESMLSRPVQGLSLGDGMPVNKAAALEVLLKPREPAFANYGVGFTDEFRSGAEQNASFPYSWPDEAYFRSFIDRVEAVERLVMVEESLKSMIRTEAELFFSGERPLAETVAAIKQKVDLYAAEG